MNFILGKKFKENVDPKIISTYLKKKKLKALSVLFSKGEIAGLINRVLTSITTTLYHALSGKEKNRVGRRDFDVPLLLLHFQFSM